MVFRSPVVWPEVLPETHDYAGETALHRMTHGRILDGLNMEAVERRARRLLYYYGSPPGYLFGSQVKGRSDSPYYTELFAHEMGHALHAPHTLKEIRDGRMVELINSFVRRHDIPDGDTNELQATASTTLVLEYLGLPYLMRSLLFSTTRNLRGLVWKSQEVWPVLLQYREAEEVQEVARQIAHLLLKMKYVKGQGSLFL